MAKRDYTESSGNVFADLGLPNADEMLAKADLAIKITEILRRRRLTQAEAAAILKVDQPKVSALVRGRLSGFSIERLLCFLLLLGTDVTITINPSERTSRRARTEGHGSGRRSRGALTVSESRSVKASANRRKQQTAA